MKNFDKEKELKSKGFDWDLEQLKAKKENLKTESDAITLKIENFKGSFYDWLNNEVNGWEKNIGQVVSDDVLFNKNLNPQLVEADVANLYGVEIDLSEIEKNVKTMDDYNTEKQQIDADIVKVTKQIQDTQKQKDDEIKKLQSTYNNDVKALNDRRQKAEYELSQYKPKQATKQIDYNNLQQKAVEDKAQKLATFKTELLKLNSEKQVIENEKKAYENQINEKINSQNLICKTQLVERKTDFDKTIETIDSEIEAANNTFKVKKAEVNQSRENELKSEGADTEKISKIGKQISNCENELIFIKQHRKLVSDYLKDKEELFDRMGEFVANLDTLKHNLDLETQKYKSEKAKIDNQLNTECQKFNQLQLKLNGLIFEVEKFAEFSNSEIFASLQAYIENFSQNDSTDQNCSKLIDEINLKSNSYFKEYDQMRLT